jgi:hypothetical protein
MTSYITKLPAVFQTETEKKFFDATFDQVFSKKDSDQLFGYLGRRVPGLYDPVNDFYIPEPSKDRTWWQLEATSFAKNVDGTKSNIFFYQDLLNRINYYGGNTLNQDRLFESEYYSWAPPIDFDMFVNYQNYYWVPSDLPVIDITGISEVDINTYILGHHSFNTNQILGATPANLEFTNGMNLRFADSSNPDKVYIVENLGGENTTSVSDISLGAIPTNGIRLVPPYPGYTPGTVFEFLPLDGTTTLKSGRTIQNTIWDAQTWDVEAAPGSSDYITIERGSIDQNAWSRTNSWYHIDTITKSLAYTSMPFPSSATRALRPIIQFSADLVLFKSGTTFKSDIEYGFGNNAQNSPALLSSLQGVDRHTLNSLFSIQVQSGQLAVFMLDAANCTTIYSININTDDTILFSPVDTVVAQDIIFATLDTPYGGMKRGQTFYYNNNTWTKASNEKLTANQPPIFQLYDHRGIKLDDYVNSSFAGSKIFSYKVNTIPGASVDSVLKFPIVYTGLGQSTDIIFENNLITDRYVHSSQGLPISGYYYYKFLTRSVLYNSWNLYNPAPLNTTGIKAGVSKQRVIDKFVVGYGSEYKFRLSVTPPEWPVPGNDLIVSVNGIELNPLTDYNCYSVNGRQYVDLQGYLTSMLSTEQTIPPVVEIFTFTLSNLDNEEPGYFEIPQQLEANPIQQEVTEISGSDLINQFTSIISNQLGIKGNAFGGPNNYRDTYKTNSVGTYILQNVSPALKTMLVSSSNELDFIAALRFSQDEYTKFKNKYLRTAKQFIDQEFNPVQYHDNRIVISSWVDAIIKTVNVSKEFSNAFAYSYMIANGALYLSESAEVPVNGVVTLSNYLDLSNPQNALYVYNTTEQETLLVVGQDYIIDISASGQISVQFNSALTGKTVYIALYKNTLPAYIPSTPTKVGTYGAYVPRMEWDTSYSVPTWVIIGHDGSKTIAYNDYRDNLLLELEKRIYNLLHPKFRNEYCLPLRLEDVKPGYYRQTRYTRSEYISITESYLNKWSTKNKANYRTNDWATASADLPLNSPELWKLYNYTSAVTPLGENLNLPGNWKGIFQYYYDTIFPDTRPWEMLGFTSMPVWWISQYGTNWGSNNATLWTDLETGYIRQGHTAIFDPVTLQPLPQEMWARPGLSARIPVDANGNIIPVPELFNVAIASVYAPFDGFDDPWVYGDGAPVEQAWMSTSGYAFSVQEFLYLMKPGPFGELFFDTVGTELSTGKLDIPGVHGPVMSTTDWQYVQNDTYFSTDPLFAWMRPKNANQQVHGEIVDGVVQVRFGYQRWVSDKILFLGSDVGLTFGQKVRTLDVNLANKVAGFINKDTTTTYIESVSATAKTSSLSIPSNNFEVVLHKGQPIKTYTYSGVVVRVLADGTFVVYGYDLQNSAFTVLDRSSAQAIDITVGGTPAEFRVYASGDTYAPGEIVRYNGVYYTSLGTISAGKFNSDNWQKLRELPTTGGVSVSYYPISDVTYKKVPYGTVLTSVQAVFDLIIGHGAYLETQGWEFTDVSSDTNQVSDWLYSAKQFLFWINTNWAPDASIQLSPAANNVMLTVQGGYPDDVETISNGIYSIMDKYGVAMPPNGTSTKRDGMSISVSPVDLSVGGIYFLQVHASETEHVLIFDNTTSFGDIIYNPLLRARQDRLRFNGFRSNKWYGKKEAPGYIIIDNQLVPNYDTIVDEMRHYYDPDTRIDNPSIEALGRHLIGYESKSYLDNLQVSDDVQYLFYQGAIRQKGTIQSLDKLFRSSNVQGNETIQVYEEWALKLAEFGNTIEQVSTEFVLKPEQNTGEVVVARMNFMPSSVGFVKEINIVNAQNRYTKVPKVIISAPDASTDYYPLTQPLRTAKAYAVLDSAGVISRIDMTDGGYGYTVAPMISLDAGLQSTLLDKFYAVWQGEIHTDPALDNIIDIDIDNTDLWTVRPSNPSYSLVFPTTSIIDYDIPSAGYVNFDDVDLVSFDVAQTYSKWGTTLFNPVENDTVWVAKNFINDWDVYKMWKYPAVWSIIEDAAGNLVLLTDNATLITPQLSVTGTTTDFGNMICLQVVDTNGIVSADNNRVVAFEYFVDTTNTAYNSYSLLTPDGAPITSGDMGIFAEFTDLLLFKTMRSQYTPVVKQYFANGDKVWIDNVNGLWNVSVYNLSTFVPHRVQEKLIDSRLFKNAQVFNARTQQTELVSLPVYDPFKGLLPALATQNITYMLEQDPARYNVTGDVKLFTENITFGNAQVGKLWWDLSSVRYTYYEQPMALNGAETPTHNLVYRRDRWGSVVTGSSFDIYEWVKSPVPPSQYIGTGTPKDVTSYVQIATSNRFTNITEINYYFWVLNPTTKPNLVNRTLTALDVSRLLSSPKSLGFTFFNPIQQTSYNNSYMFYNVQDILAYKGDNVQIQYRLAERNDQKHTQWKFFREGDRSSVVTSQYWDKMVDSLAGYTKLLPPSNEWDNAVFVSVNAPWDMYRMDVAPFDESPTGTEATRNDTVYYGDTLPVPDPSLSTSEKFGIDYRPRQGMFVDVYAARKIFVQSANNLLKHIPIRESNPTWLNGALTDAYQGVYWDYTTWYEIGFENAIPRAVFTTLSEAQVALTSGKLIKGTNVEVINGTPDGRFVVYTVVQLDPAIPVFGFKTVAIEQSSIVLLNAIYTQRNVYELAVEIRDLLDAFRSFVMVDNYAVDQNELYFSMLNYVISEQKNPSWVFKSSYIYVKENNVPLLKSSLYKPDQIDNVINYITDSKPYHTQVRDYTSVNVTSDIVPVNVLSNFVINVSTLLPVKLDDNTLDPLNPVPVPYILPANADVLNAISTIGTDTASKIVYGTGHWDANDADEQLSLPWDCNADPASTTVTDVGHWDVGTVSYLTVDANYQEHTNNNTITLLCNGNPSLPLTNSGVATPGNAIWNAINSTTAAPGGIWYTDRGAGDIGKVAEYMRQNSTTISL